MIGLEEKKLYLQLLSQIVLEESTSEFDSNDLKIIVKTPIERLDVKLSDQGVLLVKRFPDETEYLCGFYPQFHSIEDVKKKYRIIIARKLDIDWRKVQ